VTSDPDHPYAPIDGLRVIVSERGGTTSIELDGEWDLAAREASRAAVTRAVGSAPECMVLDLSRVSFIDATGVRVVVELARRCAGQRIRLAIVPGPNAVQRLFDLCELTSHLPFIGQAGREAEPRDPVSPVTGDAGSGRALSSRPKRRRSPAPTLATGAAPAPRPNSTASSGWAC
jgi:anti-sigma B factor antagonist